MHKLEDRLYSKFAVIPTAGPGKVGAKYFVLDYINDPSARPALRAYADACEGYLPHLARQLRQELDEAPEFAS